jgi:hypothetical protein
MSNQIQNPKPKILRPNKIILAAVVFLAIGIVAGAFYFLKIKSKPAEENQVQPEKNYFEISDEAAGVFFKIGKNFSRMPAERLRLENPSFIYGFSAADDEGVKCFISQTARSEGGNIILSKLRDGIFEKLKEANPDATLDDTKIVEVGGRESNKGAKLKMSYTKDESEKKIGYIQWETAGITEKFATFAFCAAPKAVLDLYREDFDLFLDSLRIK